MSSRRAIRVGSSGCHVRVGDVVAILDSWFMHLFRILLIGVVPSQSTRSCSLSKARDMPNGVGEVLFLVKFGAYTLCGRDVWVGQIDLIWPPGGFLVGGWILCSGRWKRV
jgi:hypothetical protein